jgi:putative ABC transport system permease protein
VIDATLLRPLPYYDPEQLAGLNVLMSSSWDGDFSSLYGPSQVELVRWRQAHGFEFVEGLEPRLMALSGAGESEVVNGATVSSGLFPMLGVEPLVGRAFTPEEEHSDAHLVACRRVTITTGQASSLCAIHSGAALIVAATTD